MKLDHLPLSPDVYEVTDCHQLWIINPETRKPFLLLMDCKVTQLFPPLDLTIPIIASIPIALTVILAALVLKRKR